ncbi:hypothetical protein [Silicimonas sp. MF1-12-2]|uniref:hypothetical protein n=1 Tax=Silicimonas sp. MF1-12-2 TaxID=3384793 RepID=UPI0039B4E264
MAGGVSLLDSTDVAIWTGGACSEAMRDLWDQLPEMVRAHSYLVLPPNGDAPGWDDLAQEFAGALSVDARLALHAKNRRRGVDKESFKAAGGTELVKIIKKEIDQLIKQSEDVVEILCLRYDAQLAETQETVVDPSEPLNAKPRSIINEREISEKSLISEGKEVLESRPTTVLTSLSDRLRTSFDADATKPGRAVTEPISLIALQRSLRGDPSKRPVALTGHDVRPTGDRAVDMQKTGQGAWPGSGTMTSPPASPHYNAPVAALADNPASGSGTAAPEPAASRKERNVESLQSRLARDATSSRPSDNEPRPVTPWSLGL